MNSANEGILSIVALSSDLRRASRSVETAGDGSASGLGMDEKHDADAADGKCSAITWQDRRRIVFVCAES